MRFILYMLFGVGGVLVALALGMVFFSDDETAEVAPQTQSIDVPAKPVDAPKSAAVNDTPAPQLDVVTSETPSVDMKNIAPPTLNIEIARVKPDGAAVVAGSAPPGAVISVFENKLLLGKTTTDSNGWCSKNDVSATTERLSKPLSRARTRCIPAHRSLEQSTNDENAKNQPNSLQGFGLESGPRNAHICLFVRRSRGGCRWYLQ